MVIKVVGSLAGLLKYHGKTITDSCVFRLHYRWTSSMLFLFCILLTCTEIIGNQFICLGTKGLKKASGWINDYCMITSTYTLDVVGINADIKGLGNYDSEVHERVYHAYYLWVPFVLFGMGCIFYVPHMMWKSVEGKNVEKLLQGLNQNSILCESSTKVENIVRYIQASKGLNGHYFHIYMIIEALNLVNVVTQMCLLDKFIGGQFWKKGIKSLISLLGNEDQRQDPMIQTFPRITKCQRPSYGPSGSIEETDYMCFLPQNILNEKIFLIIWIWFIILTTITASYVVMRFLFLLTPILNARYVKKESVTNGNLQNCEEQIELQSVGASSNPESMMSRTLSLGDYCLLELLQENLDYATFQEILKSLQGRYSDPFPGFLWIKPYSKQLLEFSSHPYL